MDTRGQCRFARTVLRHGQRRREQRHQYIGPRTLGAESHDPGKLARDSTYYWRVDEVYAGETVKGLVWSFATADFVGVDLTNVNTLTIGIGTKNSPAVGGTGTMYFDDIRLVR
ncbi:MAG: hypothetical protein ACYTE3_00480 [Planctomycetota bacterium]